MTTKNLLPSPSRLSKSTAHRRYLLLAAVALLTTLTIGCASAPPPAPPLQALVVSDPAAQQILLDGKPVGVAPLELGLVGLDEAASLTIELENKSQVIERRIQILGPDNVRVVLAARDEPSELAKALGLENILVFDYGARASFEVNEADLSESVVPMLENQAKVLSTRFSDLELFICGHTDSSGAEDFNRVLSLRRAQAVAKVLETNGISSERLKVQGFAADYPLAPNDDEQGKALNRRTEIVMGLD